MVAESLLKNRVLEEVDAKNCERDDKRRAVQVVKAGICSVYCACKFPNLHRFSFRCERHRPSEWRHRFNVRVEALSFKHPRLAYKKPTKMLIGDGMSVIVLRECGVSL